MIDTDEYIEMWNDHLLGSEGVQDLMNALIAEVKQLRERVKIEKNLKLWEEAEVKQLQKHRKKLENVLLTVANGAGNVPMFNIGGEAYEALWGDDE